MRLNPSDIKIIKSTVRESIKDARIYLFGSRVDDTKRGGDIDLLIVSKNLKKKDLRVLRVEFFKVFGEQKLDVILDDGNFSHPFHKLIFNKAILL